MLVLNTSPVAPASRLSGDDRVEWDGGVKPTRAPRRREPGVIEDIACGSGLPPAQERPLI